MILSLWNGTGFSFGHFVSVVDWRCLTRSFQFLWHQVHRGSAVAQLDQDHEDHRWWSRGLFRAGRVVLLGSREWGRRPLPSPQWSDHINGVISSFSVEIFNLLLLPRPLREVARRQIPSRRWRTRPSTRLRMKTRRRRKTATRTTTPRRRTLVSGSTHETHLANGNGGNIHFGPIGFPPCSLDYSASVGSEEESGKDWDELEEEARKGS